MLFRLKDATLGADNAPEWERLFVQGVGNFLMANATYAPLDIEEARRLEGFMAHKGDGVFGFLSRMGRSFDAQGARDAVFDNDDLEEIAARDAAFRNDARVTGIENAWLKSRIAADGARDPMEAALLAFLAESQD